MKIVQPGFTVLTAFDGHELERIEAAARTCYKSEDRITEGSAEKLVKALIARGHEAMLEFGVIAVRIVCDRGVSHELVRHRLCSFAQESTRYCDYGKAGEIEVIFPCGLNAESESAYSWRTVVMWAEYEYSNMRAAGIAPQIARSVLPTCLKTEIVMQGNYREWRHILRLRTAQAAHPQMREIMVPLLASLQQSIPVIFDDLTT